MSEAEGRTAGRADRSAASRGGAGMAPPPEEGTDRAPAGRSGKRMQRDRGTAVVEFVLLGVVLLVPLLYLALALSAVQRTVYGVTQAAREAGRAAVTGTAATAAARAEHAARLALADQGLPADGVGSATAARIPAAPPPARRRGRCAPVRPSRSA